MKRDSFSTGMWPKKRWQSGLILAAVATAFFFPIFLNPDEMLWGSDIVRAHSTYKQVQWRSFWEWGSFPLWDPTTYCGKSIMGDPLAAVLNPPAAVFWLSPSPVLFGFYLWAVVILSSWGMFLFARRIGCTPEGAVLAAVAFALSGKTAAHTFAGHVELLSTALMFPWIIWSADRLWEKTNFRSATLLGATIACAGTFGSVQMLYYHLLFLALYVFALLVLHQKEMSGRRRLSVVSHFALGIAMFAALGAAWWLPIVRQTLLLSARAAGTDFQFASVLSAGWRDAVRLVWPFHGVPAPQSFQSDPAMDFFWETASYPGLIALLLALLAMVSSTRTNKRVIALATLAGVALLLALGKHSPLYRLAFHLVPGFGLFRVPGRFLFYTNLGIAALAGLALSNGIPLKQRWTITFLFSVCVLPLFGAAVALSTGGNQTGIWNWMPCLVSLLLAVATLLYASKGLSARHWRLVVLCLVSAELFVVWRPHLKVEPVDKAFPESPLISFLAETRTAEGPFRILDTTGALPQQMAARHGLEIITGYHPGVYATHLDLYHKIWRADQSDITEQEVHPPFEIACPSILDMMNVEYIISFEQYLGDSNKLVFTGPPDYQGRTHYVHRRQDSLPRAYLVSSAVNPPPGLRAIDWLCNIDPKTECLVDDQPFAGTTAYREVPIQIHSPSAYRLNFTTESDGVLVVSQSWHPDWKANDNGIPIELHRVNHGQAGIYLAAGEHDLEVRYRPWDFYLGLLISGIAALVASALCLGRFNAPSGPIGGALTRDNKHKKALLTRHRQCHESARAS